MTTFTDTATVDYRLSLADQEKQESVFPFHLQQTNGSSSFPFFHLQKTNKIFPPIVFMKIFVSSKVCNFSYSALKLNKGRH
jgi:hypothetical protein